MKLHGDSAVITGGGTGIGLAIARELVAAGAKVTLVGRRVEVLRAACEELDDTAGEHRALACPGDVTRPATHAAAFDRATTAFGAPTLLINNAGDGNLAPVSDVEEEEWDRVFAVCTKATFLGIREFARRARGRAEPGAIVNVTSLNGSPSGIAEGHATYSSAKAAVHQLTRVAAAELGSQGIRVNAVAPGATRTDMFNDHTVASPFGQAFIDRTPLGRVAEPRDIARVVAFLCSEEGSWITGEVVSADGGAHLRGLFSYWDMIQSLRAPDGGAV
jgi:NAD(P)-dependent dehydrogenase (short-subunit alcohol dehydrogenase family)